MTPMPLQVGGATYAKTLFLIDDGATVGGVAGGFSDLDALDARNVDLERLSAPVLSLSLNEIATMGRAHDASLVAVGVSGTVGLLDKAITGHAALPDHPLLYLGVTSPAGALLPTPGRILRHVLVPGDYSTRSGCLASCLLRVARRGSRVVTLMHVPDATLASGCSRPAVGEIGRVDTDWIDQIKKMLFSVGVEEVRFIAPAAGASEFTVMSPAVSLVLVGATCNEEVARTYVSAVRKLFDRRDEVPALMLTAESCQAQRRELGAA
jgi:nucleotide-binding universal stress UspA family protein